MKMMWSAMDYTEPFRFPGSKHKSPWLISFCFTIECDYKRNVVCVILLETWHMPKEHSVKGRSSHLLCFYSFMQTCRNMRGLDFNYGRYYQYKASSGGQDGLAHNLGTDRNRNCQWHLDHMLMFPRWRVTCEHTNYTVYSLSSVIAPI